MARLCTLKDSCPMSINSLFLDESAFNRKFLKFYVDNITDVVVVLDPKLNIVFVNASFCNLASSDVNSITKKSFKIFLNQQNFEKLSLIGKPQAGESFKIDLVMKAQNGAEKYLNLKLFSYQDKIVLIGRDYTEEKIKKSEKNEEIRKLEEDRIRSKEILQSIGDGVISVNDKGEVIYVNQQAVNILGFSEEELMGDFLWKKITMIGKNNQEMDISERPIRLALFSKRRIYENSNLYKSKGGRLIPVSITATPLIAHDLVVGGVNVFRDITKEKEVDKMKTEFISLASHQLRTPLSATKWFAELLLDDQQSLTKEQVDLINNIYKSNQRMIDLVNSLLNISRIESGRIIIDPKPTDLRKLVEDVVFELTPKIKEKGHSVVISIHEDLPLINVDPRLIRNVYMNLLTNSIKYTKNNGEIMVMISKRADEIVSQVSDNGLGIPEDQKERIFEKFFRSSNIIKIETDGTGLGLYLAKAIVESSGGKIWFDSDVQKGTVFWFTLPATGTPAKVGEVSIS